MCWYQVVDGIYNDALFWAIDFCRMIIINHHDNYIINLLLQYISPLNLRRIRERILNP